MFFIFDQQIFLFLADASVGTFNVGAFNRFNKMLNYAIKKKKKNDCCCGNRNVTRRLS